MRSYKRTFSGNRIINENSIIKEKHMTKVEEIILNNIKYRRSIFPASYIEKEIPNEIILTLLECANYAPNHKLTQPWRFTVFKGKGLEKLGNKMADLYKEKTSPEGFLQKKYEVTKDKILRSAAVIAIHIQYSDSIPRWEEIAAVGGAIQNLWLAAKAKGIGGYWSTPNTISEMGPFLNLREREECLGLFYLGYHNEEEREGLRNPVEEKIEWVES
jgi:nitroreductase